MNAEITNPVDSLADTIASARTFAELADARRRLQHTIGILDDERRILENAAMEREQAIIRFYLPNHA